MLEGGRAGVTLEALIEVKDDLAILTIESGEGIESLPLPLLPIVFLFPIVEE